MWYIIGFIIVVIFLVACGNSTGKEVERRIIENKGSFFKKPQK